MKTHYLKCWPEFYAVMKTGEKQFEIRKDDRGFEVNDIIILKEYLPHANEYTGAECKFLITYILRKASWFGLNDGYCILSLKIIP